MNKAGYCEKCPKNCLKCGMSIFDRYNNPIIIDDIPKQDIELGFYDINNTIFICSTCVS